MNWLVSLAAALLSGVVGLLLAGVIANACTSWYRVSNREGAAGYFVVFTAIGGGIASTVIGFVAARVAAGQYGSGFGKELGVAVGTVLVIAGMSALVARLLGDVPPEIDGRDLMLEVEVRFPATLSTVEPPVVDDTWLLRFASVAGNTLRKSRVATLDGERARLEKESWIVPAEVHLFTERGRRVIHLRHGDQEIGGLPLPLPARPGRTFLEWSDWLPLHPASADPTQEGRLSCRFRVQKTVPPPPRRTLAEYRAEEAATKEAEFCARLENASLAELLPYLDYEQPQTQRALTSIAARPELVTEWNELALDEDARSAERAMRCLEKLPVLTPEYIAPVEAVGRDIAERLSRVNAMTVEEDPRQLGAADVSIRFSSWMSAVRAARAKCGGDFTKQLQTILELSRERPDLYTIQVDVCRVASFYLHQWAGIEPLPSDPKPK